MGNISRITVWNTGDVLTASALNAEFNNIVNDYVGGVSNANIAANAAIAYSKLNLTGAIVNADISASANIALAKITGTAVNLSSTQTMTNKTLTKPILQGPVGTYTIDGDGSTITFNMAASGYHTVTLGGNRVLAVSNVSIGQSFAIELVQDATGGRTVTWNFGIQWPASTEPTLTSTPTKRDVFVFKCIATGLYLGFIAGQNL